MNLQLILPCALSIPPIPRFPLDYFGLAFSYYNKYPREPASKEKRFCGFRVFGVQVQDGSTLGLGWSVHQGGKYVEKHSSSPHCRKQN